MVTVIAELMKRNKISEDLYVFSFDKVVKGELNLKTKILTDEDGNEYNLQGSIESIEGDNDLSFSALVEYEKVKEFVDESFYEQFANSVKNQIVVVGKAKNGDYIDYNWDLDGIKEAIGPLDPQEMPIKQKEKIDINDLFKKVTKTVIAQDAPARRVIVEIDRKENDSLLKRRGILLTGSTGVGKTELMRQIAKHLDRPFIKIDATQLTIPGYVGKDIEEYLWELIVDCGGNVKEAENAIIFIDEIDKKGSPNKSDVSGQGVLNVLLPLIEGSVYNASESTKMPKEVVPIDTTNMIKILGGAFSDVYKHLEIKNSIGFGNEVSSKPRYRQATKDDFIKMAGMTDEFMGRVCIIKLNDLDVNSIKRIILESDMSALKIQEKLFKDLGVKLTYTDGYIDRIAENAYNLKSGARGIGDVIEESTWMAYDEARSNKKITKNPNKYTIQLTEKTVEDPSQYEISPPLMVEPPKVRKIAKIKNIGTE